MSSVGGNRPEIPHLLGKLYKSHRSRQKDPRDTFAQRVGDIFRNAAGRARVREERSERRQIRAQVFQVINRGGDWVAAIENIDTEVHERSHDGSVKCKESPRAKAFLHELKKTKRLFQKRLVDTRSERVAQREVGTRSERVAQRDAPQPAPGKRRRTRRTRRTRRRRGRRNKESAKASAKPDTKPLSTAPGKPSAETRQAALVHGAAQAIEQVLGKGVKTVTPQLAANLTEQQCKDLYKVLRGLPQHESSADAVNERGQEARASRKFQAKSLKTVAAMLARSRESDVKTLAQDSKVIAALIKHLDKENPVDVAPNTIDMLRQAQNVLNECLEATFKKADTDSPEALQEEFQEYLDSLEEFSAAYIGLVLDKLQEKAQSLPVEQSKGLAWLQKAQRACAKHGLPKAEQELGLVKQIAVVELSALKAKIEDEGKDVLKRQSTSFEEKHGKVSANNYEKWAKRLQTWTHPDYYTRFCSATKKETTTRFKAIDGAIAPIKKMEGLVKQFQICLEA